MKLARVEISGFRSIGSRVGFPVGAPTILAGHNDAGKSATIDAVRFLLGGYAPSSEDATKALSEGEWSPVDLVEVVGEFTVSADERAELEVDERIQVRRLFHPTTATSQYQVFAQVPADDRFRELEALDVSGLKQLLESEGLSTAGLKPELLSRLHARAEELPCTFEWVECPKPVIAALPALQYFDATSTSGAEQAVREALDGRYKNLVASDKYAGVLRSVEIAVAEDLESESEQLRAHIDERLADGASTQISPEFSFKQSPLTVKIARVGLDGRRTPMSHGGAGTERRVALAVWEHNTRFLEGAADTVVVYDEPDTHLDYLRQRELMDVVREQATLSNVVMLIATHSMNLIDGVDISDVVHVRAADGSTTYERLEGDADVHLSAIAASLGLRNTVLLHERLFVGVEGETERAALPMLYLSWRKRHLESAGIAIWDCGNNEGALAFARFLHKHGRNVAFVVDADSREESKNFTPHALTRFGLDADKHAIYIGDPREFEDMFPDEVWAACATQCWPRKDGQPWGSGDFAALRTPSTKKFSDGIRKLLYEHCDTPSGGKPRLAVELAAYISEHSLELPESLRRAFEELEARASA